jgi:hypothetical protein
MLKKIFITIVLLLTACSGASDDKTLKDEIPKLDRTDTIAGIDENGNGIRDDIEKYIVENYRDEGQKKALFQFAKTVQESLLVDISDMIAVKTVDIQDTRALHCILLRFDVKKGDENPSIAWEKIRSMTTNTKERLKAYLRYNKALDGTASSLPTRDTCE